MMILFSSLGVSHATVHGVNRYAQTSQIREPDERTYSAVERNGNEPPVHTNPRISTRHAMPCATD